MFKKQRGFLSFPSINIVIEKLIPETAVQIPRDWPENTTENSKVLGFLNFHKHVCKDFKGVLLVILSAIFFSLLSFQDITRTCVGFSTGGVSRTEPGSCPTVCTAPLLQCWCLGMPALPRMADWVVCRCFHQMSLYIFMWRNYLFQPFASSNLVMFHLWWCEILGRTLFSEENNNIWKSAQLKGSFAACLCPDGRMKFAWKLLCRLSLHCFSTKIL